MLFFIFLFLIDAATSGIYTLSLHDALPISAGDFRRRRCRDAAYAGHGGLRRHARRDALRHLLDAGVLDRKSTRLNSSHQIISYAVFCLKKKKESKAQLEFNNALTGNVGVRK